VPLTTLDPTPALVAIDLQKGIVSGTVAHVVPNAAALAKAFRQQDLPVVSPAALPAAPTPAAAAVAARFRPAGRTSSTSWTGSRAIT
jgi:nicotinamidase-related amidase